MMVVMVVVMMNTYQYYSNTVPHSACNLRPTIYRERPRTYYLVLYGVLTYYLPWHLGTYLGSESVERLPRYTNIHVVPTV